MTIERLLGKHTAVLPTEKFRRCGLGLRTNRNLLRPVRQDLAFGLQFEMENVLPDGPENKRRRLNVMRLEIIYFMIVASPRFIRLSSTRHVTGSKKTLSR